MADTTRLEELIQAFTTDNQIAKDIKTEAREVVLEAKDEALKVREEAEKKLEEVEKNRELLQKLLVDYQTALTQLSGAREAYISKVEHDAKLSADELRTSLRSALEQELSEEAAQRIRQNDELIRSESDKRAREILVTAMQRVGTDGVGEYTTYTIDLPDEDMKGRIIGKDGRNIKSFEDVSGVSVEIGDQGEPTVTVSSFDPVKREIARIAMERLVADGRIQPTRIIEEMEKATGEVDKIIKEAGEDLLYRAKVSRMPDEIITLLGRLKFRSSYGQNMIEHTLEVIKIGVAVASEVGANVEVVRQACLLHDMGKAVTAETDKTHAEVGAEISRRYGVSEEVVQAFEFHHDDKFPSLEAVIMYLADAISGARPGARKEDYEGYVERVKELETIANSFPGVDKSFAISAGKEVRIIVNPAIITDAEMVKLAHDISKKIHDQITNFPAPIKVTVIRELVATAVAKSH
ncbi:ribonuclease Y [candidate division WWE3 bacterium CG_4_9_14_3_um_filter_41_6]|nr:MAG: ribonuclease Y [Candidatus Roizmanbacteria bacterium CG_4_10_14_0_2_um_filter_39_12]PJA38645.1 MAG: ribonuclease Y [candidate division WWE3 bacterium CG_4_9_14_3_um_filter_41_6]